MRVFIFKKELLLSVSLLVLSFHLVGCEEIPFLTPKKTLVPKKSYETTSKPLPVQGTPVAKINNMTVTLEDLNLEIENFNSLVPEDRPELKITTVEQKIDYLNNEIVRRVLLYQDALNKGMDRNPDVSRALRKAKMDIMVVELIRKEADTVNVTSQEIEEYYNTYKEQLKGIEERRIREIVVASEMEAREILIKVLQGADFATLAKERSKSSTNIKGGDLGFIQPGTKFAKFDQAAFVNTLDVGKVSNIFKGPDGYYVIKLEAKRGGEQKSLSELWDDIKRGLTFLKQQAKIEELIANLSGKAKIDIYKGAIK